MAGIAGANELNDRQRFRNFYRTDVSSEFVGPALAEMARQFNWRQMAIITQGESLFTMVFNTVLYYTWWTYAFNFTDYRQPRIHIQERAKGTGHKYNTGQKS